MEFFCYHRDRTGSLPLRLALLEDHWTYMDGFADAMIARGPTYSGETLTGSVHVLELPDAAAARRFAFDEPGYQAGAYRDVLLRRWRNLLGRTMWEFATEDRDATKYLVLGLGPESTEVPERAPAVDGLIAFGPLFSDDGAQHLGTVALVQAADPDVARSALDGAYQHVEVSRWDFGGRDS